MARSRTDAVGAMTPKKATIAQKAKKALPKKTRKTTPKKDGRKRTQASLGDVEADIEAVLLQLMAESESDSVRVSAAKALMEKLKKYDNADDDVDERHERERLAAIAEARSLLEELALAKRCGNDGAPALDQRSAPGPADSAR